jgi:hypothetical protein
LLKLQTITISIAGLKATELMSVSNIQCWRVTQFELFSKPMLQILLTKTFKIIQYFKTAFEECRDVKSKFPNLHKANVSKLTKNHRRRLWSLSSGFILLCTCWIFLEAKNWKLDFATFP